MFQEPVSYQCKAIVLVCKSRLPGSGISGRNDRYALLELPVV